MKIYMNDPHFTTIDQIERFLKRSQNLSFTVYPKRDKYHWISKILIQFSYGKLRKKDKTIIKKYIGKITGYSKTQVKRLIRKHYRSCLNYVDKKIKRKAGYRIYTPIDIGLLIKTDSAHQRLSGAATKKIFVREFLVFKNKGYERLADISVSHIYNLRATNQYKSQTSFFKKTNPVNINIGERRKPESNGQPGYIRVDTVHQGDKIGLNSDVSQKGIYHINTVCEVTQWEIIACVEKITERFLLPILLEILEQYPFRISGFHADNGSEFINHRVANLLNKLLIQLTKSRPRHSNDNALVETKNNIIRKHFGYIHIPQPNAKLINEFYQKYFNIYLNFHRPCGFATIITNRKGKQKKIYKTENYDTPYERLKKIPKAEIYLKDKINFDELNKIAYAKSDNEFAEEMMKAKNKLFKNLKFNIENYLNF